MNITYLVSQCVPALSALLDRSEKISYKLQLRDGIKTNRTCADQRLLLYALAGMFQGFSANLAFE